MARLPLTLLVGFAGLLALPFVAAVVLLGLGGSGAAVGAPGSSLPAVPISWRLAEQAASCPGLPAEVLGALGWLASRSGRLPSDHAPPWSLVPQGPFGIATPGAAPARSLEAEARRASRRLCAATGELGPLPGLSSLLGSDSSALEVEVLASALIDRPDLSEARASAVDFAVHALGLPYEWGGNGPASYDCSGLTVAALRSAGTAIPRTAQAQHDAAEPTLAPQPGDLVFFGSSQTDIGHVGLVIGGGRMIDAPHAGAVVRIESSAWSERQGFGSFLPS